MTTNYEHHLEEEHADHQRSQASDARIHDVAVRLAGVSPSALGEYVADLIRRTDKAHDKLVAAQPELSREWHEAQATTKLIHALCEPIIWALEETAWMSAVQSDRSQIIESKNTAQEESRNGVPCQHGADPIACPQCPNQAEVKP